MKIDYWLTRKWVGRTVLSAVLIGWNFLVIFAVAKLSTIPLPTERKVCLFVLTVLLYFAAWALCRQYVFADLLDNRIRHRRYWLALIGVLTVYAGLLLWRFWWGLLIIVLATLVVYLLLVTEPREFVISGAKVRRWQDVRNYYQYRLKPKEDRGILWSGIRLPTKDAVLNFLFTGCVGAGKTLSLQLLMRCVIPQIQPGSGTRALVYDFKREMPSLLAGLNPYCEIHIFNPLDQRCTAWDLAVDITTETAAETVASILIPMGDNDDEFFVVGAREAMKGVIIALNTYAPEQWTFRDLIEGMRSQNRLIALLSSLADTTDVLDFFGAEKQAAGVMAQIRAKVNKYKPIAALWHRAQRKLSLKQWSDSESILLLAHDTENKETLQALNRVLFDRVAQILLKKPNVPMPCTWIFLDEVGTLGRLGELEELAKTGRSKGVSISIGFQSISDLNNVYSDEVANTIVSQFLNKAILRLSDEKTMQWAESLIGDQELLRYTRSERMGKLLGRFGWGDDSFSQQEHYTVQKAVKGSEFREIQPVDFRQNKGLQGYYIARHVYRYRYPIPYLKKHLPQIDESLEDFVAAPDEWQKLTPWDKDDLIRLGLVSIPGLMSSQVSSQAGMKAAESTSEPTIPRLPTVQSEVVSEGQEDIHKLIELADWEDN